MSGRPCTLDASLLLTLGKAGRIDVLSQATSFKWYLTPLVREELKSGKTLDAVERAILEGTVDILSIDSDDRDAVVLLSEWRELVDPGEAEAIAVAQTRGWLVALEDRHAQRLLDRRVGPGRWTNSAAILVSVVQAGHMTVTEADVVFRSLDVYRGYANRGLESLEQLM